MGKFRDADHKAYLEALAQKLDLFSVLGQNKNEPVQLRVMGGMESDKSLQRELNEKVPDLEYSMGVQAKNAQ